jgi:hypothetical protein
VRVERLAAGARRRGRVGLALERPQQLEQLVDGGAGQAVAPGELRKRFP